MIPGLRELAPGLGYLPLRSPTLPPATTTNCVLLGDRDLVAVDPGTPYEDERRRLGAAVDALGAAGRRVRSIWLTHHHHDHVAAAVWLAERTGAPIAAHPRTAALLGAGVPVTRLLDEGPLDLGGRAVDVLHTPGHTTGHLCFLDRETGILLAGDVMAGVGTVVVDPPEGDMTDYLATLHRLRALAPGIALPAHGEPIRPAVPRIDEYIAHRAWREERVARTLGERSAGAADRAVTAAELVPAVYADVPPAAFPLALRSLTAHLEKLAREGRAVPLADGRWRPA